MLNTHSCSNNAEAARVRNPTRRLLEEIGQCSDYTPDIMHSKAAPANEHAVKGFMMEEKITLHNHEVNKPVESEYISDENETESDQQEHVLKKVKSESYAEERKNTPNNDIDEQARVSIF